MIRGVQDFACSKESVRSRRGFNLLLLPASGGGLLKIIYDQEVLSSLAVPQNQAETPSVDLEQAGGQ